LPQFSQLTKQLVNLVHLRLGLISARRDPENQPLRVLDDLIELSVHRISSFIWKAKSKAVALGGPPRT
jgi:hypothetical protein